MAGEKALHQPQIIYIIFLTGNNLQGFHFNLSHTPLVTDVKLAAFHRVWCSSDFGSFTTLELQVIFIQEPIIFGVSLLIK